jgi:hypothetical protein
MANAVPIADNGAMIVSILGLSGISPMGLLLITAVIAILGWRYGGRPPRAS